jgi:8-oxo-dGTP diphosphatase
MSKTLTELFTTAAEHSPEWTAEWGGGPSKPCPCCKGTGEHDEGECQLCDGGTTVSAKTPDDARGRDCHRTGARKTAAPGEESQHTPGPVGLPDENSYTHDQGVHRGVSIVLSPEKHKFVHDPAQPAPAKAHLLLSELKKQNARNEGPEGEEGSTGGLGNYWSPSPDKGAEYAAQGGFKAYHDHERAHNCGDEDTGDGGCPTTQVVVHADTPVEKDHWHERFRDGEKYDPAISWRLPVRPGAKVNVRGVSWREGNDHKPSSEKYSDEGMKHHTQTPFSRYDFAAPVRKQADLEERYDGGDIPSRFLNQHGVHVRVHTAGHPNESTGEHIPADIRPSEIGFSGRPLERRTAGVSFGPGGKMGEDSYEEGDGYSKHRWDEWHPKLQQEIHRHLALDLPASHPAHDDKLPLEERARAVLQHTLTKGNVGVHWTDDQNYKHLTGGRLEAGQTPVILHAKTPPRDHIEDNDYVLEDRAVRDWDTQEREVPLKRRAPVQVTGITWHTPRGGAVRHNFEQPFRVHAALKDPDEVECNQGHTHWGQRGAAGLLVRHTDLEGTHHYLLQQRAENVDHPGTWSTPGGAIEQGESPFAAGTREGNEELGDLPPLGHIGTHSNDHGGWSYHTVIADSPEKFTPTGEGSHAHESAGHGWFTTPQIDAMGESDELHPGFAESWPEVRHRAETEVPHQQMRLFASSRHAPAGTFGTDNEGHRVQMTLMDGWAHDDGSHGHEDNTNIGDHPVYTETHTWLPSGRYWGPNSAQNDQRLFEGDHLRPEVRSNILDRVGAVLRPHYKDWAKWAKVYFAGSEAARWQPFNGDFDILIGIDWPEFHKANPDWAEYPDAGIAAGMTDHFWMEPGGNVKDYWFTLQDGRKVGPFDRTFFVNPKAWDIRDLHPYAAYNVTDDDWAVHPLEVPADWDATHLPESYWTYAESLLHEIRAIGQLPEEERHRMASNLWDQIHTHRSDAFADGGKGLFDLSNVVEKYLDQHPDRPWAQLTQWKNESPDQPMAPVRATLSGLFAEGTAKGADGNGIMIAVVPPEKVGKKLLVEDGEPLEALHMTLCYLGSRKEHPKGKVDSLGSLVRAWARTQAPFTANIGGAGTFTNPESHVLWAAVDIPGGGEIRQSLSDLLEEHGYKVRNDHGWTPHITLKYHNSHVRFLPKIEPATWEVREIMLCLGGDWRPITLGA